jgi:hypothetical protein
VSGTDPPPDYTLGKRTGCRKAAEVRTRPRRTSMPAIASTGAPGRKASPSSPAADDRSWQCPARSALTRDPASPRRYPRQSAPVIVSVKLPVGPSVPLIVTCPVTPAANPVPVILVDLASNAPVVVLAVPLTCAVSVPPRKPNTIGPVNDSTPLTGAVAVNVAAVWPRTKPWLEMVA